MGIRSGDAADAGLDAVRLEMIDERARSWVESRDAHRTVVLVVARHGVVALHEAYGVDGPEPDAEPLRRDAIFPMFSQTKTVTATMLLQLVEDGLVGLTRPVHEYLPEFVGERKQEVLVHHLLTHTSGMDTTDFTAVASRLIPRMGTDLTPTASDEVPLERLFLELSYTWPVAHPPGEVMRYSATSYLLLGEIIRRVTGRSLDEHARDRVFGPLGMTDSSYGIADDRLHRLPRRSFEFEPEAKVLHSPIGRGAQGGAGGMYSTALDLARFMQMVLDRGRAPDGARVLHPTTIDRMTTNQLPGVPAQVFDRRLRQASNGFGLLVQGEEPVVNFPFLGPGVLRHGGAGYQFPWADPATGVVGVFCSVADQRRTDAFVDMKHTCDQFTDLVSSAVVDR